MSLYKRGLEKEGSVQSKNSRLPARESSVRVSSPLPQKDSSQKKVVSGTSFKTEIDKFYHLVEISPAGVSLQKVLEILDASDLDVEEWARVLERQALIDVVYPPTGGILYRLHGNDTGHTKRVSLPALHFKDFFAKKFLFIFLAVLFLVLGVLGYLYTDSVMPYFNPVVRSTPSVSSVATDVPSSSVTEKNITLENAFSGDGVYTCTVILGVNTSVYSINYTDMYVEDSVAMPFAVLSGITYVYNGSAWESRSLGDTEVMPGGILPSYDSYTCLQDSLNSSVFEGIL